MMTRPWSSATTAAGWCRARPSADLLSDRLGVQLPHDRDYATVAGFALSVLKHLPETGEKFRHDGWTFEIVDLDGRKIDKLIASRSSRRKRDDQTKEAAG